MDDVDHSNEDGDGKRSVVIEEDLAAVPNKRLKEEKEKSPYAEKSLCGAEISKARQRWNLLSYHLRCIRKQASDATADMEAMFVVFEVFVIPKLSNEGRWYHLKSPVRNIEFDVHIYSAVTATPNVLVGFNNSGNIRVWPSEECLAYYLLKHEKLVRSKTVLELGSGMVGLSGLTSVALGSAEVVLTDGNEKSVQNIRRIVEINKLSNHVTCSVLPWNITIPNKKFDVVLCADCLFFTEEHRTLLNCIYRHLKPNGIAYIMAPDRGGTVRTFLDLVYEERKRWQSYQEIVDAIHYSCMLIQDEVVEELEKKGQKMEFDKEVVAQVAFAICDTLCVTWPSELLQFAKHARRSTVNISDLRLLFRRNENVLSLIGNIAESSLLPARKRQSRKGANKNNSKAIDSTVKMDNENSKDMDTLLSENKDTLKLTDFWNHPSTSRERSLLLFGTSSKYISATTVNKKLPPNSIPLQKKGIAVKKKQTPSCRKQKTDIVIRSKETDNRSERQNQITKPAFHLNGSESKDKQELESLDVNIPCYSGKEDLQREKSQSVSGSLSITNRKIKELDLSKEIKMNEKNPTVSILELHSEILNESSTTVVASRETSHTRANKTGRNKTELRTGNFPSGKSNTPLLNSMSGKRFMDTSLRSKSSAADDCFSSFKFESDDEDLDPSLLLTENNDTNNKNAISPSISNNKHFTDKYVTINEDQNTSGEESDIGLDATVFDF
ncbi:putative methyltransferase family protein [Acanthocheilonema viteae]